MFQSPFLCQTKAVQALATAVAEQPTAELLSLPVGASAFKRSNEENTENETRGIQGNSIQNIMRSEQSLSEHFGAFPCGNLIVKGDKSRI